jgi:hypothetical protein
VAGRQRTRSGQAPRFRVSGRIALDLRTGLNWMPAVQTPTATVAWEEALHAVAALNRDDWEGGHLNWRLPNVRELESLVDLKSHSPALPTDWPVETDMEGYWTATTSVYEPRYAWVVYMRDGAVGVGFKSKPEFGVWAVASDG